MSQAPVMHDTAELMAGLDRHKLAKGSPELYDALLHGNPYRVRDELSHFLRHPLAAEFAAWLVARGVEPPRRPSNDEILKALGITDIEATLQKKDSEIAKLRKELDYVQGKGSDALKAATGYSFTSVLMFGVALLGWLAAFGVLPFSPQVIEKIDTSKPPTQSAPENDGVGIEGGGGGR